ncbi:MAG: DUF2062 domain-containing protein [Planctomycetota bacterium]|nr:MAG: DUF2062 domain-containing protein [Planctomycetota bacterium]
MPRPRANRTLHADLFVPHDGLRQHEAGMADSGELLQCVGPPCLDLVVPCTGNVLLLQHTQFISVPQAGEVRFGDAAAFQRLEDDARPGAEGVSGILLKHTCLIGGQTAQLHQCIQPHGIEGRQVAREPAHTRTAPPQIVRGGEIQLRKLPLKFRRRRLHPLPPFHEQKHGPVSTDRGVSVPERSPRTKRDSAGQRRPAAWAARGVCRRQMRGLQFPLRRGRARSEWCSLPGIEWASDEPAEEPITAARRAAARSQRGVSCSPAGGRLAQPVGSGVLMDGGGHDRSSDVAVDPADRPRAASGRWAWLHPRFILRTILMLDDTPHSIALGTAIGTFVGLTPTVGLQMVIVLILDRALRCFVRFNRIAALLAVYISNPLTVVPIYYLDYRVGTLIFEGGLRYADFRRILHFRGWHGWWRALWTLLVDIGAPLIVGSLIVGAVGAAVAYPSTRWAVQRMRGAQRRRAGNRSRGSP